MSSSTNTVIRARIDQATKRKATTALKAMGLSPSDAIRMPMVRVARDKVFAVYAKRHHDRSHG